jgi:hypothetical protein
MPLELVLNHREPCLTCTHRMGETYKCIRMVDTCTLLRQVSRAEMYFVHQVVGETSP